MSSSLPPDDSSSHRDGAKPLSPDQLLPPVEPPSAGFILQLFVIPAVIVACVVGLWLVVERLARKDSDDPVALVASLRGAGPARYQRAMELANMLTQPERYHLQDKPELAKEVASLLGELVEEGDDGEADVTMRVFLCKSLGEFHVDDGLPALVAAARDDEQLDVRIAALEALAVLSGNIGAAGNAQGLVNDTELMETLRDIAHGQEDRLRSQVAFTMGVIASAAPELQGELAEELVILANDPYTDARFNAGLALARIKDPRAVTAVAEMFDPASLAASLAGEKPLPQGDSETALRSRQAYKRDMILHNAVDATLELKDAQLPAATLKPLVTAMQRFLSAAESIEDPAPAPREIREAMQNALAELQGG